LELTQRILTNLNRVRKLRGESERVLTAVV